MRRPDFYTASEGTEWVPLPADAEFHEALLDVALLTGNAIEIPCRQGSSIWAHSLCWRDEKTDKFNRCSSRWDVMNGWTHLDGKWL